MIQEFVTAMKIEQAVIKMKYSEIKKDFMEFLKNA